jgi:predicted amino acid racemase
MGTPRLEIQLEKITHNARSLLALCAAKGVGIAAVTKGVCGSPEVASALIDSGISVVADSRLANLRRMREAGIEAQYLLIRSPKLSEAEQAVQLADISLNTELQIVRALARQAARLGRVHGVIWMVEMGDLREGLPESALPAAVEETLSLRGVKLAGIGTNLGCFSGVIPDEDKMRELSDLVVMVEGRFAVRVPIVSGGNSASCAWVTSASDVGRVNQLRFGEAILLGRETVHGALIPGLYTDAFTLVAEVIESQVKPSAPVGELGTDAFGHVHETEDHGRMRRTILALGEADTATGAIRPRIEAEILGASSDHLLLDAGDRLPEVGSEVAFDVDYEALLRSMISPYVDKVYR